MTTYTILKGAAQPRFVVTSYLTGLGVWSRDGALLSSEPTVSTGGIADGPQGAAAAAAAAARRRLVAGTGGFLAGCHRVTVCVFVFRPLGET